MKLTHSLVAMATLTTLSFAGGDINPVTVFEQEPVMVPVEVPAPVVQAPVYTPVETVPVETTPVETAPVVQAPVVQAPVQVEPKVVAPVAAVAAKPLGLYLGLGLTGTASRETHNDMANVFSEETNQDRQGAVTGKIGYDFMNYLGAELRGTYGFSDPADNKTSKFNQIGAYLKPNYDVLENLNLYALLGASKTNNAGIGSDETGFSYGAGLDYGITNNISVFADWLNYMMKDDVPNSTGLTFGAAYNF